MNPGVLFVKTEETFAHKASHELKEAGLTPLTFTEVPQTLVDFEVLQPALVIIDRQLGGEDGVKFCQHLRKSRQAVVIIMLVEEESVNERAACLSAGADDYFLKPYRSEPFLELVRFYLQPKTTTREQLQFNELILDLTTRRLVINEQEIELTMKEFELLRYLMSHPREVLTREQILENVWGYDFRGASNVIEVYIRYLRLKLESEGQRRLIHTVRTVGYVLRES